MTAVRRLHADGFDPVDEMILGLACCGYVLAPGARILDFGCGTGDFVYRLRDRGYEAYGFDIHNVVAYRKPEDRQLFRFSAATSANAWDMRFDPAAFSVGFSDDSFDLVFSTQALEHVQYLGPVMREIARVLAPGGISLHVYPRRSALIEPHFFVPLGGWFHPWWWLYLWALLGVRNEHQHGWTVRQTADLNAAYCRSGVNYRTDEQIMTEVGNYFSTAAFVDRLYYKTKRSTDRMREACAALRGPQRLARLAPLGRMRVLLMVSRKAACG